MTAARATRATKADYLSIVEAAYSAAGSTDDWVQGVAEAARPILDRGLGVIAYAYDAHAPAAERVSALGQAGGASSFGAGAREFLTALPSDVASVLFPATPPVELLHRIFSHAKPTKEMINILRREGADDAIGVRGSNPDGRGIILAAATSGLAGLSPRQTWSLNRVASHLAAAARLRLSKPSNCPLEDADAIFTPRGYLEHFVASQADDDGRNDLRNAIQKRLLANAVRTDPRLALELWHALIAGRWSIVDHVDNDGKRFILAKRNAPGVREPASLTANERLVLFYATWGHSNKLIGYETGLSPAAVSTHLRRALRKLRMKSRTELARVFTRTGSQ
jgi:DNA-binding NarL/FixJ family response regulator